MEERDEPHPDVAGDEGKEQPATVPAEGVSPAVQPEHALLAGFVGLVLLTVLGLWRAILAIAAAFALVLVPQARAVVDALAGTSEPTHDRLADKFQLAQGQLAGARASLSSDADVTGPSADVDLAFATPSPRLSAAITEMARLVVRDFVADWYSAYISLGSSDFVTASRNSLVVLVNNFAARCASKDTKELSVFLMYSLSTSAVRRMRDYKEEAHLGEEELAALHEQAEQARIASFRVACREMITTLAHRSDSSSPAVHALLTELLALHMVTILNSMSADALNQAILKYLVEDSPSAAKVRARAAGGGSLLSGSSGEHNEHRKLHRKEHAPAAPSQAPQTAAARPGSPPPTDHQQVPAPRTMRPRAWTHSWRALSELLAHPDEPEGENFHDFVEAHSHKGVNLLRAFRQIDTFERLSAVKGTDAEHVRADASAIMKSVLDAITDWLQSNRGIATSDTTSEFERAAHSSLKHIDAPRPSPSAFIELKAWLLQEIHDHYFESYLQLVGAQVFAAAAAPHTQAWAALELPDEFIDQNIWAEQRREDARASHPAAAPPPPDAGDLGELLHEEETTERAPPEAIAPQTISLPPPPVNMPPSPSHSPALSGSSAPAASTSSQPHVSVSVTDLSPPSAYDGKVIRKRDLEFLIACEVEGDPGFIVQRSWSEFEKLNEQLLRTFPEAGTTTFPRAMLPSLAYKTSGPLCHDIEAFLRHLLLDPRYAASVPVNHFLARERTAASRSVTALDAADAANRNIFAPIGRGVGGLGKNIIGTAGGGFASASRNLTSGFSQLSRGLPMRRESSSSTSASPHLHRPSSPASLGTSNGHHSRSSLAKEQSMSRESASEPRTSTASIPRSSSPAPYSVDEEHHSRRSGIFSSSSRASSRSRQSGLGRKSHESLTHDVTSRSPSVRSHPLPPSSVASPEALTKDLPGPPTEEAASASTAVAPKPVPPPQTDEPSATSQPEALAEPATAPAHDAAPELAPPSDSTSMPAPASVPAPAPVATPLPAPTHAPSPAPTSASSAAPTAASSAAREFDKPEHDDDADASESELEAHPRTRVKLNDQEFDAVLGAFMSILEAAYDLDARSLQVGAPGIASAATGGLASLSRTVNSSIRRGVLKVLDQLLRTSYSERIKAIFSTSVETATDLDGLASHIDKLRASLWPLVGDEHVWWRTAAESEQEQPAPERTDADKEATRRKARAAIMAKAPTGLCLAMGTSATTEAFARLFDAMQGEGARFVGAQVLLDTLRLVLL